MTKTSQDAIADFRERLMTGRLMLRGADGQQLRVIATKALDDVFKFVDRDSVLSFEGLPLSIVTSATVATYTNFLWGQNPPSFDYALPQPAADALIKDDDKYIWVYPKGNNFGMAENLTARIQRALRASFLAAVDELRHDAYVSVPFVETIYAMYTQFIVGPTCIEDGVSYAEYDTDSASFTARRYELPSNYFYEAFKYDMQPHRVRYTLNIRNSASLGIKPFRIVVNPHDEFADINAERDFISAMRCMAIWNALGI